MKTNIRFDRYKCFQRQNEQSVEMDSINVLIGRNNSGKSSIIDIIEYCTDNQKFRDSYDSFDRISVTYQLNENHISGGFHKGTSGGGLPGDHYKYGMNFEGEEIRVDLFKGQRNGRDYETRLSKDNKEFMLDQSANRKWADIASRAGNPLEKYDVLRVSAERDIQPEEDAQDINCLENGIGATNTIHKFINHSNYNSSKVEVELLQSLNQIVAPDNHYKDIVVQQIQAQGNPVWEVFLEENNGIRVPLSKSGSGLKTVILVLINLILLPSTREKSPSKIIFAFEELENNLHPALQRNLFKFVADWIIRNNSTVVFTTHSHIAINLFDSYDNATIGHVTRNETGGDLNYIQSRVCKYQILDDLEVKASDILQSNGVIWVEGPSDRIYMNKWIEEFSNKKLIENVHYQIMFYGGRLLSHLTLDDPDNCNKETDELINLLLLNKNSVILIDSDKRTKFGRLNKTKKRIQEEYRKQNQFCWITKGKEIENYLTADVIEKSISKNIMSDLGLFENIEDYLECIKKGLGVKYARSKVKFAKQCCNFINKK